MNAPAHSAQPPTRMLLGIALLLAGLLLLTVLDTSNKLLGQMGTALVVVAWARFTGQTLLMLTIFGPIRGRRLFDSARPGLQWLRGAILMIATMMVFMSLKRLPLGEAMAIFYLAPLLVVGAAPFVLGEQVNALRWLSVVAGFIGVLVVLRPGNALDPIGVAFALGNALLGAVYNLLTRKVMMIDNAVTTLFYSGLVGCLVFSVALPFYWPSDPLTPMQIALLVVMGLAGTAGHTFFVLAFRNAPASLLGPFSYFHIVFAVIAGMLVFHHLPDTWSGIGIGIICASGIGAALSERTWWRVRPAIPRSVAP